MLSLIIAALAVAVKRIISGWKLEIVLFLGIVLAVALMSSGVIFSNLLAEAALRHTLEQASPEEANFWVRAFSGQDSPLSTEGRTSEYAARNRFTDDLQEQGRFLETATFFFQGHSQLELDNKVRPRGQFKFSDGLIPPRIQMISGRWPYSGQAAPDPMAPSPGMPVEVALESLGAELLQLGVGDRMEAIPASSFIGPPPIQVEIVGIYQRPDPNDEFWYGSEGDFTYQNDQWTIVPMFTTQEAILGPILRTYPALYTDATWFYYLDRKSISAGDVGHTQGLLTAIERDVRAQLRNSSIGLSLDQVLRDYEEQLLLARIPLFLIHFLVTGI